MTNKTPVYLGIDIGGTAVKYGWGNPVSGFNFFDRMQIRTGSVKELSSIISKILDETDTHIGLGKVGGIGLGTAGMIDNKTKKLVGINPNLKQWINLNPVNIFPEKYRSLVRIENDANLMALAEALKEPDAQYVIGITIGTGIGCGFVQNGRIYKGSKGLAMELGHNIVKHNGALCNCGRKGCLEAYTSLGGLRNRISALYPENRISGFVDIIYLAAKDRRIKRYFHDAISYLAVSIANLAINLDPDLIVIGGGAVEIDVYPVKHLFNQIAEELPLHLRQSVRIKRAEFGNSAGVMGAIILAGQDNL